MQRLRGRAIAAGVGMFVAGLAVASSVGWALFSVASPAQDPLDAASYTLVEVTPGEVGASLQLNAIAQWVPSLTGANRAAGVVTGIHAEPGAEVTQGSLLYTVDLRPVVVAQGDVPAFRAIGDGTVGEDVRQLQQMLTDLGFYEGSIGGEAGELTAASIRSWQKSLGIEQTGVVAAGDVIFVPTLPARILLDDKLVYRGATLAGGEAVLSRLPASPEFTIPVSDAQAASIPSGTKVEITSPDGGLWTAYTGAQASDAASAVVSVALYGQDGTEICGGQCSQVPVTGQTKLLSRIVTVETVKGNVVPSSALVSGADGQLAVVDENGLRINVTVVSAARGMSVVDGVNVGVKVRVPGEAGP